MPVMWNVCIPVFLSHYWLQWVHMKYIYLFRFLMCTLSNWHIWYLRGIFCWHTYMMVAWKELKFVVFILIVCTLMLRDYNSFATCIEGNPHDIIMGKPLGIGKEKSIIYPFCSFWSLNCQNNWYRKSLSQDKVTLLSMENICHRGFKS